MLRSMHDIVNAGLQASDGRIGTVLGFIFDSGKWKIRYFVVDVGAKTVVLPPLSMMQPAERMAALPVNLTREQVRLSPEIDYAASFTRETEADLFRRYGSPHYWHESTGHRASNAARRVQAEEATAVAERPETGELLSAKDVVGAAVAARDGDTGVVADMLVDDGTWDIRSVIVETAKNGQGRKVVLSPWDATRFESGKLHIGISIGEVMARPPYTPAPMVVEYTQGERVVEFGEKTKK